MENIYVTVMSYGDIRKAMEGCRLSYNSGHILDSAPYRIGVKDFALAKKLVGLGSSHSKFMRAITITLDVWMPLYWWKQFDQYKVGTTTLSESTMHTLSSVAKFDKTMFSVVMPEAILSSLNDILIKYKRTHDKKDWKLLIGMLPSAFIQRRIVYTNLEVLRNIFKQRSNHKLDEWRNFIDSVYSDLYDSGLSSLLRDEDE